MAVGDVKSGMTTGVLSMDIRPPAGEEWVIHNIYYNKDCTFSMSDGTTNIQFDTDTSAGARLGLSIHVTNNYYIRIVSSGGSFMNFAYDGVQTK